MKSYAELYGLHSLLMLPYDYVQLSMLFNKKYNLQTKNWNEEIAIHLQYL